MEDNKEDIDQTSQDGNLSEMDQTHKIKPKSSLD